MGALYEPGKNPIYSYAGDKSERLKLGTLKHSGYRRKMTVDEFTYYRTFLSKEDLTPVIKGAIGLVLKADLKRLYGPSYDLFLDSVVEEWADYYFTLNTSTSFYSASAGGYVSGLDLADSERLAFESYLAEPVFPYKGFYTSGSEEVMYGIEQNNRDIMGYQTTCIGKNNELVKQTQIDAELDAEKRIAKMKFEEDRILKEDPGMLIRREDYIRDHISEYLAGYFVNHPISLGTDGFKSDLEFGIRQRVLGAVKQHLAGPSDALAYYDAALDIIYSSQSKEHFSELMRHLDEPTASHPLKRMMRAQAPREYKIQSLLTPSTAHPLKKVMK